MNWRNVDPEAWLLCMQWIGDVMNHTAEKSTGWRPPLEVRTGQTVDISILLVFLFWDVVYVPRYKDQGYNAQPGHDKSSEIRGRFVGFAWNVGHQLTFKTTPEEPTPIDEPPLREIPQVETVNDDDDNIASHQKDEPEKGSSNTEKPFIFKKRQMKTDNPTESGLPPEQMIERTFLMPPAEDGT
ncbi:hypothetical protein SEMRO_1454_G274090.1 [Seminavis robusta]|uniref:Uncharacterized protein n=1 Tax=Seminavis robusta TaxID=568900 RepID=A0A9N8ER42_9STRA|nr:hypothetical protein SEMRO_1454_G274090.1 [Seminavis robusta]|eukprot:Sro1454_g274090.1 n/a (184) ;mRNA; r:11528-12079